MNPRTFARRFRQSTGQTPARFVEAVRVEAARFHLEGGVRSLDDVAAACGLGREDTPRRSFVRLLGTTPAAYRENHARGQAYLS